MKILDWALRLIPAIILLQTLFFKFTGAPESIYIFETVGMEPWGRYGSGVVELIAAIMLLVPRTAGIGAVLALGTISGAIFFHLTKLGIEIKAEGIEGDGGLLFYLAIVVFATSAIVAWRYRKQIPVVKNLV